MTIFSWRRRRGGRRQSAATAVTELSIPTQFLCPISLDLMKDPVTLSTGITYDRESIEAWVSDRAHNTCPVTNRELAVIDPIPNRTIRRMIQEWCVEMRSHGVERIPTPRTPLTSSEASDLLASVAASTAETASQLTSRIKKKASESERDRSLILAAGGAHVIAAKFVTMSKSSQNDVVLEELFSCLALFAPELDDGDKSLLGSEESLKRIVLFLKGGDTACRRAAISVLKELAASQADELASMEGVLEGLVSAVKDPICTASLKNSLVVIHHIIESKNAGSEVVSRLLDLDAVSDLLEIAISLDRGLCEKALGVLKLICEYERGAERMRGHAMAVPLVVKKMLRVSDLATEYSVSILWKICRGGEAVEEALEVGAFQKLLLVLQVGRNEEGREKATELLKLLNGARRRTGRLECVDSMDFRDLKRSF